MKKKNKVKGKRCYERNKGKFQQHANSLYHLGDNKKVKM